MLLPTILAVVFLFFELVVLEAKELKIAFWIDPVQSNIYEDIASSMKEIEILNSDIVIKHTVIVVENDLVKRSHSLDRFCKILSTEGVSAVIDFTYNYWQEGYDLVKNVNIPYLSIDRILSPILGMFGEFLKLKEANDVVLIFQNAQDRDEALLHIVEGFPFRTMIINAFQEKDFVNSLKDLRPSPSYYGVFARGTNMNAIFEKISKGNLFVRPHEWHFVFLDPRDRVFKYKKEVEFATKFSINGKALCRSLHMKDSYCLSRFTLRATVLLELLRSLYNLRQENLNILEVLITECNDTSATNIGEFELLENLRISNFLTYSEQHNDRDERVALSYMVNVSINFYSNEHEADTDLATWEFGQMRKINETISPAKRFFRIGVTEASPWNYYRRDPHTGEVKLNPDGMPIWEGFCIDFIHTLADKLNFEYELISPKTGKFGKRDQLTGSWDGIVGDLVSGETDFAVAALKMYTDREEVIDFIAPYFEQTGISIVIRQPVRQTSLFKFMTVLRLEVWLSIIAALVATAIMVWLLDKYSPYSSRNNKKAYPYGCREFTLRESFWFALTSFTPQGGGEAPKAVSGRILVAAYWLFVVLMLATFTANLAAFLTVERMQTPVQSLEQLARQSRINYTVVDQSDVHQYFINMKFAEDTLYRMWKELALNASSDYHKFRIWDYPIKEQYGNILLAINSSNPVFDAEEGFRKVNEHENADFAFIHDSSEIKYEITRNCNLTEIGEVFAEQPYAIAVQQGSHIADELSYAILELQKDRYFEELKAKYWNRSRIKCPLSEDQEGITLESLGGVFIATLFGLGMSMVTLVLEVIYYKKKNTDSRKVNNIIKVSPISENTHMTRMKDAWHLDKTPPPSFETATFRGAKMQASITLGSNSEFKPRGIGLQARRLFNASPNKKDLDESNMKKYPPYME